MWIYCGIYSLLPGCRKCLHPFPRRDGNVQDCSDTSTWVERDGAIHKEMGRHSFGIKNACVQPMHNLLLWISKHVYATWVQQAILNDENQKEIDRRIRELKIPSDLGRIPGGIPSKYKSMKADEWKHWALVYSPNCLREVRRIKIETRNEKCKIRKLCQFDCSHQEAYFGQCENSFGP